MTKTTKFYTVKDLMQKKLKKIDENKSVQDACKLMKEFNIRSIPCISKGKLTGIITSTDIIYKLVLKDKSSKETKIKDIMKKKPIKIDVITSDIKAAHLLEKHAVKHLLVVNGERLVGIFTKADMIKHFSKKMN